MVVVTVVVGSVAPEWCPDIDVARQVARALSEAATVETIDPASLGRALAGGARPGYLVVDSRTLGPEDSQVLDAVRPLIERSGAPVAFVYGRLDLAAIRDMLLWPPVDDVVLVTEAQDIDALGESILRRIAEAAIPPMPDDIRIGSMYDLGEETFAAARIRSLFSNGLTGFVRELMGVGRLFARYPLATRIPWDPKDAQPAGYASQDTAGLWRLTVSGEEVPNLSQVLNAHLTPEAQGRLSGEWLERRADSWVPEWKRAWADGAKSPLVLILGESGTGKSLAAETIADLMRSHQVPHRGRFMKVNCGALTEDTFTHTLMGAAPRTWTGVDEASVGELVRAAHGVVFFDEIGDLAPEVQRALLTFLDDRRLRPAGMSRFRGFQHILAATNRDVDEGAAQQWFRNDLLARFEVRLTIPPLRERPAPERERLVDFVAQDPTVNPKDQNGLAVTHIQATALAELVRREYRDGNFREMQETVHGAIRSASFRRSRRVTLDDVPAGRPVRSRSDRDSRRVRVENVDLPADMPVVDVASEQDLRLLAEREGRALLTDRDGSSWVLSSTVAFRARVEA